MDGGGKIDAKIPEELDGGDSLVPKSSEVNEEDEPTCLLPSMAFLCQSNKQNYLKKQVPKNLKPPPPLIKYKDAQLIETDKICRWKQKRRGENEKEKRNRADKGTWRSETHKTHEFIGHIEGLSCRPCAISEKASLFLLYCHILFRFLSFFASKIWNFEITSQSIYLLKSSLSLIPHSLHMIQYHHLFPRSSMDKCHLGSTLWAQVGKPLAATCPFEWIIPTSPRFLESEQHTFIFNIHFLWNPLPAWLPFGQWLFFGVIFLEIGLRTFGEEVI